MLGGTSGARIVVGLVLLLALLSMGTNGTESCVTMPPPAGSSGSVYGSPSSGSSGGPYSSGGGSTGGGLVVNQPSVIPAPAQASSSFRLRNLWKKDESINIEQGFVQCGLVDPGWWSAMWQFENAEYENGVQYQRIRNRWKPNEYLHVETGQLQSGPIQTGWWSAMWSVEQMSGFPGYVRIRNRWKPDQYIHNQYGQIQCGPIQAGWWSAGWLPEAISP